MNLPSGSCLCLYVPVISVSCSDRWGEISGKEVSEAKSRDISVKAAESKRDQ